MENADQGRHDHTLPSACYVVIATAAVVKTARIREKHHTGGKAGRPWVVLIIQSPASIYEATTMTGITTGGFQQAVQAPVSSYS